MPQEYILKGVVNAAVGQENGAREHRKIAQQYFQLVGGSASECDTIPGRLSQSDSTRLVHLHVEDRSENWLRQGNYNWPCMEATYPYDIKNKQKAQWGDF